MTTTEKLYYEHIHLYEKLLILKREGELNGKKTR